MTNFETILFALTLLILLSILVSKLSFKFGIPSLLLFLVIGMLAGSDGIGKIYFDDQKLSQEIGIVSLCYILFAGGIETDWNEIKPILPEGLTLSTLGVLFTTLFSAIFTYYILHFTLLESFLLGAIVSSTDAASVFNVLKTSNTGLKKELKSILELESGSNDTIAVVLTIGIIRLIQNPGESILGLIPWAIWQLVAGVVCGYLFYKIYILIHNKVKLEYGGLYIVFITASVLFIYALTSKIGGNGFLAVYVFGILVGNENFLHKRSIHKFMDGLAWLMQIAMFLTLGLLVFPSRMAEVILPAIAFSFFLIFFARPFGVFITLLPSRLNTRDKHFLSWVGLRGAAPIILATFPYTAGINTSETIFNIVFFTVLISLLVQGSTVKMIARLTGSSSNEDKIQNKSQYPFEIGNTEVGDAKFLELMVPFHSSVIGKPVYEIKFPKDAILVLICRGEQFIVPTGQSRLEGGDVILVLAKQNSTDQIRKILSEIE